MLTVVSINSFADEGNVRIKLYAVEMKCYIGLLGGGEAIHFVNSNQTTLKGLANLLTGSLVIVPSAKQKKEIYKVKECVPLGDKFENSIAQQLDDNTVR